MLHHMATHMACHVAPPMATCGETDDVSHETSYDVNSAQPYGVSDDTTETCHLYYVYDPI
eukprot:4783956-Pyramimonas_sp.AAC.1